jgi:hypothetical protein
MSTQQEKSKSFLRKLDQWLEANVMSSNEWSYDEESAEDWKRVQQEERNKVRSKVLKSYRDGFKDGARRVRKGGAKKPLSW